MADAHSGGDRRDVSTSTCSRSTVDQVGVPARLSDATVATITLALLDHLDRAAHADPQDIRAGHDGLERECLLRSQPHVIHDLVESRIGTRAPVPLGRLLQPASKRPGNYVEGRAASTVVGNHANPGAGLPSPKNCSDWHMRKVSIPEICSGPFHRSRNASAMLVLPELLAPFRTMHTPDTGD